MALNERILSVMAYFHLKQVNLAHLMQISQGNVSMLLKDKLNPGYESLANLCSALPELNPAWLLTGKGNMLISEQDNFVRLPIVGNIAAGIPMDAPEIEPLQYIPLDQASIGPPEHLICFRIYGDSMVPLVHHGDIAIINKEYFHTELDRTIAAIQINGENTLKQIVLDHSSHHLILMPLNCRKFDPLIFDLDSPDNITIIGVLSLIIRKF